MFKLRITLLALSMLTVVIHLNAKPFPLKFTNDTLVFENDYDLSGIGDAILRPSCFVYLKKSKPCYRKGMFYFQDGLGLMSLYNTIQECSVPNNVFFEDSIHELIINGSHVKYYDYNYTKVNASFFYIYVNKKQMYILNYRGRLCFRRVKIYYIIPG